VGAVNTKQTKIDEKKLKKKAQKRKKNKQFTFQVIL